MKSRDFRSDTVTKPTDEMRKAMYSAEVGDDVCGDDPTVIKLEELAANKVGKEASLFVPSGTFGNQLCILTHTNRGNEVILSEQSHIIKHEAGAASIIGSIQTVTVDTKGSYLTVGDISPRIREIDLHYPSTGLICIENALANGTVMPIGEMEKIYSLAKSKNIPVHLDGARIFNASITLGVKPQEIAKYTDSVMFCLSKGLCSPIGSMVCGSKEFIDRARKNRKIMGGAMRQVGIIASAGIVSLNKMVDRLIEDHYNAKYLGERLAELKYVNIDLSKIQINMVFFSLNIPVENVNDELIKRLQLRGFKLYPPEDGLIRFLTHNDVDKEDIDDLIKNIKEIVNECRWDKLC